MTYINSSANSILLDNIARMENMGPSSDESSSSDVPTDLSETESDDNNGGM